jgi:hypothetical protein
VTTEVSWRERWNPPWTRERAKKVARVTAIVLAASWLLYVLVGNLLINTSLLSSMISKPGEAEVDWGSGSTWWPGRFHVQRFRLRTHDSHVEMQLNVDDTHFTLVLAEALAKRLHFTRVEGDGLAIRIRQRIDPDMATPARLALLPDIEGFPNPPIKDPVRKPQKDSETVAVQIENIDVSHVREVWIDELRYTGDTHVLGGFYFQPKKRLAINGAHVDVISGGVHMGKNPVSTGLAGTIDCTVQPFDVSYPEGAEILGNFDVGLHLDGRLENLRWVNFFVNGEGSGGATKKAPIAILSGGAGALHAHIAMFHGVLKAGTTVDVEAKGVVAEVGSHTIGSDVVAKIASKDPVAPATRATITASVTTPFTIRATGHESAIVTAKKASIFATSHELDLARGFSDAVFSADVDDTHVAIAALDPYVATSDFHVVSGEGLVKAHVDLDPKADLWKGESTVVAEKLGVRYQGKLVTGNVETRALVPKAHAGVVDLSGSTVDMKDVRIENASRTWFGHVDLVKAEAHDGPIVFVADLKTRGRDARPLVRFFPVDLPAWMTGLLDLEGLAGTMKLKVGPDLVAVENVAGKGGDFTVEGNYTKKGTAAGGAFLVSWHMLTVGFDIRNDHVGLVPLGASSWYRDRKKNR